MEKENWINEIIDTTNQIVKVAPRDELFANIQNRLNTQKTIDIRWVWLVAASILVLVSMNIKLVLAEIESVKQSEATALAATIIDTNQFYTVNYE